MCFDESSVTEIQASLFIGVSNELCLHFKTGLGYPRSATVLIRSAGTNNCSDRISVADGIGQPFNEYHTETLSPRVSVRPGIERVAEPIWRQEAHVDGGKRTIGCESETRACDDSLIFELVSQTP